MYLNQWTKDIENESNLRYRFFMYDKSGIFPHWNTQIGKFE